ncbi:tRNA lysidine(34) synthetase TilS [Congregibacter variabilis]|uniref:tRNA(Ile)-lysidine synthase n=1 Tax=Congregibacter variabilis TaxID=3081200 RepID=A0ABZ0I5U4_9GAMM|nr:tRNA lysidine(34) synthetase TilS [Congregibacter sp. IMCC43200]
MRDSSPTVTESPQGVAQNPVLQAFERHAATLDRAAGVYVAFSGGLDSTVLLHGVKAAFAGPVIALHANHGLNRDADRWANQCAELCSRWNIPFSSTRLELHESGHGVEAAARTARYRWFESCIEPGAVLLMAHHQDDQAETLLLRLLRGAGPQGLVSIPVARPLGHGSLLRPLLDLPRSDLQAYAMDHDLVWIDDPSNADTRFDRNYLRQEIMPLLAKRWPGYRSTLSRAATQLRELSEHLPGPVMKTVYGSLGDPGFAIDDLPREPALAALALRQWLKERSLLAPPAARLLEFLRQMREGAGAQLCGSDWTIERYRDAVYLHPRQLDPASKTRAIQLGETLSWPGMGKLTLMGAEGELLPDLSLCTRRGGERLALASGHHKDLKTVFQEQAVPPWWRNCLPLLVQNSAAGEELLAVAHLLRSPRAVSLGVELVWEREEIRQK